MDRELDRSQIKDIFRRRKKGFMVIFLVLFLAGFVIALALPPIYRSESRTRRLKKVSSNQQAMNTLKSGSEN